MNKILILSKDIIVPRGKVVLVFRDGVTGKIKNITRVNNLVTTVGKEAIADALRGTQSNNRGIITYCALGTDDTAPDTSNTALGAELFRKLISVREVSSKTAIFQTFFATGEANGTLKEAGLFGDDAGEVANSGILFCHTAISRVKSSSDTLTLLWSVIIG